MPELFVTNYNRNFTGVSATAANVVRQQVDRHDLTLVGQPLPGCPVPLTRVAAGRITRKHPPQERPFAIWHVRRTRGGRRVVRSIFATDVPCRSESWSVRSAKLMEILRKRGEND